MRDEPLSEPDDRTSMEIEVPAKVDSEFAAMSIPENPFKVMEPNLTTDNYKTKTTVLT